MSMTVTAQVDLYEAGDWHKAKKSRALSHLARCGLIKLTFTERETNAKGGEVTCAETLSWYVRPSLITPELKFMSQSRVFF